MKKFDFSRFNFFGNYSNNSSKKRADKQRRGRQCRIEELEGREMLSASPWTLANDFGYTPFDPSQTVEAAPDTQGEKINFADLVINPLTAVPDGYHAHDWAKIEALKTMNEAKSLEAVLFACDWKEIDGEYRLVDFAYDNGSPAFAVGGSLVGMVDLSGCEYLTRCFTYGNGEVTGVNVTGNTSLRHLAIRDCEKLATLNVTDCTFLREIECWRTGIAELNLAGLSNLNRLDGGWGGVGGNEMPNLNKIDISGTQISELHWGGHGWSGELIARNAMHLQWLEVWGNNITKLDLTGSTNVKRLELGGNTQLSTVDGLAALKDTLWQLRIENTAFAGTLDLQGFSKLRHLRADNLPDLEKILIHGTNFLTFERGGEFEVGWGEYRDFREKLDSRPTGAALDGATLHADDLAILTDNNLLAFATWEKIDSVWRVVGINGHGRLQGDLDGGSDAQHQYDNQDGTSLVPDGKLDVTGLSELRFLRIGTANLFEVKVAGLKNLTHLDIAASRALTVLDTTGCTALEYLNIEECRSLTDVLDLKHLTGLQELRLRDCNHLDGVDLTNLKNLKYVAGWWVGADSAARETDDGFVWKVTGCENLEVLFTPESPIKTIDLTGCTNLKKLVLYAPGSYPDALRLTSLDLSHTPNLIHLELGGTRLETLDLTGLTKLARLQINDISTLGLLILGNAGTDIDTSYVPYDGPQDNFDNRFMISTGDFQGNVSNGWAASSTLPKNSSDTNKVQVLLDAGLAEDRISWAQVGTELRVFSIDASGLTLDGEARDLDLSGMTALRQLRVDGINLLSLDVSGNTRLAILNANGNWDMESVDLTGCKSLVDCRISDNLVTSIDLSEAAALFELHFANTNLTELKLHEGAKNNLRVVIMWGTDGGNTEAHGNRQPNIAGDTFKGFTALRSLNADRSVVTDWDFTGCTSLWELRLTRSAVTNLDLTGCVSLRELYVNELTAVGGGLRTIDMTDLANLWRLDAFQAGFSYLQIDTINNNPDFEQLWIGANPRLQAIYLNGPRPTDRNNLGANDTYVWLPYDTEMPEYNALEVAKLAEYGISKSAEWKQFGNEWRVVRIDAQNLGLSGALNWNFTGFNYLVGINLSYNNLNSVNITGAANLTSLQLYRNNLSSLNVSQFAKLEILEFGDNNLTQIDIAHLNNTLIRLRCENNDLTSLDLAGFTKLQHLYAPNNKISGVLDLSKSDIRGELTVDHNQLEGVIIAGKTGLTRLNLQSNRIEHLDASGLTYLVWLNAGENGLKTLDVTENIRMEGMHVNTNNLTELDLSTCVMLTDNLGVRFNNLKPSTVTPAPSVTSYTASAFNNQTAFSVEVSGDGNRVIDLSAEFDAPGTTLFTWYDLETGVTLSEGTDYTAVNGVFTFNASFDGIVYAVITNSIFRTESGREFQTVPVAVGDAELNYNENEFNRLIASGIEEPMSSKFVTWKFMDGEMRVTAIEVTQGSGLTTLDLTNFDELTLLNAGWAGTLESVTLANNPKLTEVRLHDNSLTFATLPKPQPSFEGNYDFGGQASVSKGIPDDVSIDDGFEIDLFYVGATEYAWFLNNVKLTSEQADEMFTESGGKFTFDGTELTNGDVLRCDMTNPDFAGLTIRTVNIVVGDTSKPPKPSTPTPATPTNVTAVKTDGKTSTSVTVTWNLVTSTVAEGTNTYELQYSVDGDVWITVTAYSEDAGVFTAIIDGLAGGKDYQFRVRTIETVGTAKYASEWSAVEAAQTVTTDVAAGTATVAKPTVKVDKKAATVSTVTLNVTKNAGASYIVTGTFKVGKKDPRYVAADKGVITETFSYTVKTGGSQLVITGLQAGTKYTFMVTAIGADGSAATGKNIVKVAAATAKYTASKIKLAKVTGKSPALTSFQFTTTPPSKAADVSAFDTFQTKIVVSYTVKVGKVKTTYEATLIDGEVADLKTGGVSVMGDTVKMADHPFKDLSASVTGATTTLTGLPAAGTKYAVAVSTLASGINGEVESLAGKANISTAKFAAPSVKTVAFTAGTPNVVTLTYKKNYTIYESDPITGIQLFTDKKCLSPAAYTGVEISEATATGIKISYEGAALSGKGTLFAKLVADGVESAVVTLKYNV